MNTMEELGQSTWAVFSTLRADGGKAMRIDHPSSSRKGKINDFFKGGK